MFIFTRQHAIQEAIPVAITEIQFRLETVRHRTDDIAVELFFYKNQNQPIQL